MRLLQSEQATFLLQSIALPALKNEHRTTKKIIEAIPLDKGDYRPDPVSKTALELAWHIAAAENWFLESVIAGEFKVPGAGRPESVRNSADVARWYTERFEKNFHTLTQLSDEQLMKVLDFKGLFQNPAVIYLQVALNHSIHHRGQLTTYLRPMGARVPSIYGESYDDAQARKSAQA
jgi:uncharacterized damage-inducible protein DinB